MKKRMIVMAAVVGVALLTAALPVLAAPDLSRSVVTGDAAPGGQGQLVYKGNGMFRLRACDVQADGYGVRAYASYRFEQSVRGRSKREGLVRKSAYVAKNVGGKGTCSAGPRGNRRWTEFRARPDKKLRVQVCLRDHDGNRGGDRDRRDHHCGPIKTTVFQAPVPTHTRPSSALR